MVVIGDKYKSTELVCVVQSRVKTMNTTHGAMGSMSLLRLRYVNLEQEIKLQAFN